MRNVLLAGVFAALALVGSATPRACGSEGFDDLAKMAKAGVNDDVFLAFIDTSPVAYDLTVDEILFFTDLGISPKVVTAIVKHGKTLREAALAAQPAAPPVAPIAAPITPVDQPQDPVIGQPDTPPIVQPVAAPPPQEFVSAAPVVAPAPEDANISYFYQAMTPYGQWSELDGQWVWQPTCAQIDDSWRPYCHRGHWLYTDSGWAWQSDYSWGWAPFHYGRWALSPRLGWVWYPDTVWGPAWVSWRNSETHAGWAPLPPSAKFDVNVGFNIGHHASFDFNFGLSEREYTFVPVEHFYEPVVTTYIVPRAEVAVVFGGTTVVENHIVYRDDRVVNVGISVDFVSRKTHREIKPIVIVDANVRAGDAVRGNAVVGAQFTVFRPKISNAAPVDPRVIRERRDEELKRAQIRQQELTARTQIHQQNLTDQQAARDGAKTQQVEARNDARTQETIARQQAEAQKVQARQQAELEKTKEHQQGVAAAADNQEKEREQRLAADAQRKADQQKATEQRRQADLAEEKQRQAAEVQKQADKERAAELKRQQGLAAEQQRGAETDAKRAEEAKAQADARAREDAKRAAEAKAAADAKARRDAEADARRQAQGQKQPDPTDPRDPKKKKNGKSDPNDPSQSPQP